MARRILVVDDDPTIRSSFTEALADEETDVRTAASGGRPTAVRSTSGLRLTGPIDRGAESLPHLEFDIETGEWRRLADDAPLGSIHPDGRRVAFADGEREYEVWVMEDHLPDKTSEPGTRD